MNIPAAAAAETLSASALVAAVRSRYPYPEWRCESEITFDGRRLDVVAFNLWGRSRGYRVVGFEIKVSRGDWMRELQSFQKSESWMAIVDSFYVVTPPKLVRTDELPEAWGLLELVGDRMMSRRHASQKQPAATLPREVCARFISRAIDTAANQIRTAEYHMREEMRREVTEEVTAKIREQADSRIQELTEKGAQYDELSALLGIQRHEWKPHERTLRLLKILRAAQADDRIVTRLSGALANLKDGTQDVANLLLAFQGGADQP